MTNRLAPVASVCLLVASFAFAQKSQQKSKHGSDHERPIPACKGPREHPAVMSSAAPKAPVPATRMYGTNGLGVDLSELQADDAADLKCKPPAPRVDLRWQPSPTKDIAGYCIYRADGGIQGKYRPITPHAIKETHYTDCKVKRGKRYGYRVSAIAYDTMESLTTPPALASVPKKPKQTKK